MKLDHPFAGNPFDVEWCDAFGIRLARATQHVIVLVAKEFSRAEVAKHGNSVMCDHDASRRTLRDRLTALRCIRSRSTCFRHRRAITNTTGVRRPEQCDGVTSGRRRLSVGGTIHPRSNHCPLAFGVSCGSEVRTGADAGDVSRTPRAMPMRSFGRIVDIEEQVSPGRIHIGTGLFAEQPGAGFDRPVVSPITCAQPRRWRRGTNSHGGVRRGRSLALVSACAHGLLGVEDFTWHGFDSDRVGQLEALVAAGPCDQRHARFVESATLEARGCSQDQCATCARATLSIGQHDLLRLDAAVTTRCGGCACSLDIAFRLSVLDCLRGCSSPVPVFDVGPQCVRRGMLSY